MAQVTARSDSCSCYLAAMSRRALLLGNPGARQGGEGALRVALERHGLDLVEVPGAGPTGFVS